MGWGRQPITSRKICLAGVAAPLVVTALASLYRRVGILPTIFCQYLGGTKKIGFWIPKAIEPTSHQMLVGSTFSVQS